MNMLKLKISEEYLNLHPWGVSFLQEQDESSVYSLRHHKRPLRNLLVMESVLGCASRYLDPLLDFGFKHIFGRESDKEILIDFLNELFKGQKVIRDLHFQPTERPGAEGNTQKVIFDLLCTGDKGEHFILEMQYSYQEYFMDRVLHYACRMISEQLPRGKKIKQYHLKEVHLVALLNFSLPDTPETKYLHDVGLMYMDSCKRFSDKLAYKFIELVKFDKGENELVTGLAQWLYLLRNLARMNERPACLDNPIFEKVFQLAEIANLNKEELRMYQSSLQDQYDVQHVIALKARKAKEEGRMEGEKRGIESKELSFVQTLVRDTDFDNKKIASLAAVTVAFVKKIREELSLAS